MTPAQVRQVHKKFDSLRARYVAAWKKTEDLENALSARYAHHRSWRHWITTSEKRRIDELRARQDKIADELFALIQSISPRDWSSGVPAHWIYEELPFEDVIRPRGERLSVTPPLSYSATRHME